MRAAGDPGALPAASDAASMAGCVRGRSDRQPVQSLLRAAAPQLAKAYGEALHGSCTSHLKEITTFSVVLRGVLQDRGTAVLELRHIVGPRDWVVVLNRQAEGWRTTDPLVGMLAR